MPNKNEMATVQLELLSEIKALRSALDVMMQQNAAPPIQNEEPYKPNNNWSRLDEPHIDGSWWRCPLARQMLTLTNAQGETWGAVGMRNSEDSLMWIDNMAIGDTDEDILPPAALNFWVTARVRFTAWKRKHGLG